MVSCIARKKPVKVSGGIKKNVTELSEEANWILKN